MLHVESAVHIVASLNQSDPFDSNLPNSLRQVMINFAVTSRTGSPVPLSCSHQKQCATSPGVYRTQSAAFTTRIEAIQCTLNVCEWVRMGGRGWLLEDNYPAPFPSIDHSEFGTRHVAYSLRK